MYSHTYVYVYTSMYVYTYTYDKIQALRNACQMVWTSLIMAVDQALLEDLALFGSHDYLH